MLSKEHTENMKLRSLVDELALALEVASRFNGCGLPIDNYPKEGLAWKYPSPFQEKINELLKKAGREPK
jgi:hypothetical protein